MTRRQAETALSRRSLMQAAGAAALVVASGAILNPREAWGLEVKALDPKTMQTLILVARDIYPHDRLPDRVYAVAVKEYDEKAAADPAVKAMIEDNIAGLDKLAAAKFGSRYVDVGWEAQRVGLLRGIETTEFFQKVRGGLVVSLYNQKEIWPLFGYQGEAASQGGYINRGFNDITWL